MCVCCGFNQRSEKSDSRQGSLSWIPRKDKPGVQQGLPGAVGQGPLAARGLHKLNMAARENERYNMHIYMHITVRQESIR